MTVSSRLQVGRDLIIRGGVNIAPEIDNIMRNPKVRSPAVGVPDRIYGRGHRLCRREGWGNGGEEEVKSWCSDSLPDFKAPKRIFFMDDLPKSDRVKSAATISESGLSPKQTKNAVFPSHGRPSLRRLD